MAQANILEEGIDRFQTAFQSVEKEYRRLQKQADRRRRTFEKRAEKEVKRLRTELRKSPVLKRVETLRSDATSFVSDQMDGVLSTLRIASRSEISKLDRKVSQLNRKVRELEKTQSN